MRVIAGKLVVLDRTSGGLNVVTEALDRSWQSFACRTIRKFCFFTVVDRGRQSIQMIPAGGGGSRVIRERTHHAGRHAN